MRRGQRVVVRRGGPKLGTLLAVGDDGYVYVALDNGQAGNFPVGWVEPLEDKGGVPPSLDVK